MRERLFDLAKALCETRTVRAMEIARILRDVAERGAEWEVEELIGIFKV